MNIVLSGITQNGVVRCSKELILKLEKAGYKVFIVAPQNDYANEQGFNCYDISISPHGKNVLREIILIFHYIQLYKRLKPDIVINYTIKPNVYSGIACRLLHIKYIGSINGIGDALYNSGIVKVIVKALLRIGLKKANSVFFQNKSSKRMFIKERIIKEDIAFLVPGSGINLNEHVYELYPNDVNGIKILYIGRITKDKGGTELIETAITIKKKHNNVEFVVVGEANQNYHNKLMWCVNNNIITYLGKVASYEVHRIIKESHAVIMPSYHEGISNVLLEGAAAGRPVIATFVPGCQETFEDGVTGIGFREKSVDSMIDAVERFIRISNQERQSMGINGRKKVSTEFDRELVDSEYLQAINRAIEEK